jgi:formate dehydrogenase major subunit
MLLAFLAWAVGLKRSVQKMGPLRSARTLLKLNQAEGFDCMSCAWPDPDPGHRHTAEFCENGAKAVAEEATTARATPEFFARYSIADLDRHDEHWLGQQGRITHPMIKNPGATHYEPIEWDAAFPAHRGSAQWTGQPDEAIFYTSGRTSNEAAFCYQLFVGRMAPTTCLTVPICATSRRVLRSQTPSASGRRASFWKTFTTLNY